MEPPNLDSPRTIIPDTRAVYHETRWSLVLKARAGSSEALDVLGSIYWPAVYAFLRRRGFPPEDAQDLTQETFRRVLAFGRLSAVDPSKGRFRSFLCACAEHEASHFRERNDAEKRGGRLVTSLETVNAEKGYRDMLFEGVSSHQVFDRSWSLIIVGRAMERIRSDYTRLGKGRVCETLLPMLNQGAERGDLRLLAEQLDVTEGNARVMWSRFKAAFVASIRSEVAETVADPADIDAELRHLVQNWLATAP